MPCEKQTVGRLFFLGIEVGALDQDSGPRETITKKTILFDGHVAGNIVSFEQAGEPLVGYWIGKEYWGKGVATKALSQLLGHVKARPLYARAAKHNISSIRVLEKCGFTISGNDKAIANAQGDEIEEVILKLRANAEEAK